MAHFDLFAQTLLSLRNVFTKNELRIFHQLEQGLIDFLVNVLLRQTQSVIYSKIRENSFFVKTSIEQLIKWQFQYSFE